MENKPIYPIIFTEGNSEKTILTTFIRKKHEGKWYLWKIKKEFMGNNVEMFLHDILIEAYNVIILGKITIDIIDRFGNKMFIEDSNQMEEIERLSNLIKP